jgi:hypothetical protein
MPGEVGRGGRKGRELLRVTGLPKSGKGTVNNLTGKIIDIFFHVLFKDFRFF